MHQHDNKRYIPPLELKYTLEVILSFDKSVIKYDYWSREKIEYSKLTASYSIIFLQKT